MSTDKLALYDNVLGVFADLDDGGLTNDEALTKIRSLAGARIPVPDKIVLMGTLPFTITIDTRTKEVEEFEINYTYPNFDRCAEKRLSGEEVTIDEEQLTELIEAADTMTASWPEPERM